METIVITATFAVLLFLDVKASILVLREDELKPWQRATQLGLVWLVPLLGALLVLAIYRSEKDPPLGHREFADPGDDFGASGGAVRKLREAIDGD